MATSSAGEVPEPCVAETPSLRVVVVGRSVYGLHGVGGLERHLYDLLRHHLADGWHVTLVTRTPGGSHGVDPERWRLVASHPRFRACFVPYRTFPFAGRRGTTVVDRSTAYPWFGRRAGRLAASLVSRGEADIVYGVGASAWGYAVARAGGARAPLVFNPQGLEEFGGIDGRYGGQRLKGLGYLPLRAVVKRTAHASDAVIATDRAIRPTVLYHLGVDPAAVRLIPNGIDVVDADQLVDVAAGRALRAAHGIDPSETLLLSVGRVEENKGFGDLAAALAAARPDRSWRWVLVGDGPARAALAAQVHAAGLGARVLLAGRTDDRTLHAWYDATDVFVHPTRYEGSSLVTLEAMLHRRAVIATRAGGLPDKVVPDATGWLTQPGSPAALAATLEQAFSQRERWAAYGQAGRALLEQTFDWRVIQSRFAELYAELVSKALHPARG